MFATSASFPFAPTGFIGIIDGVPNRHMIAVKIVGNFLIGPASSSEFLGLSQFFAVAECASLHVAAAHAVDRLQHDSFAAFGTFVDGSRRDDTSSTTALVPRAKEDFPTVAASARDGLAPGGILVNQVAHSLVRDANHAGDFGRAKAAFGEFVGPLEVRATRR